MTTESQENFRYHADISDSDIYEAMKHIPGYLDITPADLREVFDFAYHHAVDRITSSVRAEEIMRSPVYTAGKDTPLIDVAELMAEKNISGLPVLDTDGRVAGMISEKDFLGVLKEKESVTVMKILAKCLQGKGCLAASVRQKTAGDIMTSPAITIPPELPLFQIMIVFSNRAINRAPVIDPAGSLLGIVSRADIIGASVIRP
ncbi:MAG: CBS domain-containing protein [Nitrospirae bacterium]|nr:CBS domain-containing protein [Nitrospirota bacterium]